MTRRSTVFALAFFVATLFASASSAQKYPLEQDLKLTAHGGVSVKIPKWKDTRTKDDVAVREHDETKTGGGFYLLMLTIEPGPKTEGTINWDAIRTNIINEAKKGDSTLELTDGGEWKGAAAFKGRRMSGTLKIKDQSLAVELLGLIKDGKLVTVSVLTGKASGVAGDIIESVGKTAKLGG